MPSISFLNPAYLIGLSLLAIPLAVHLITRRTAREIAFSDLRFLREALMRRKRQLRLENRNLLLLRMLVFLLLVFAVSKPVLRFSQTRIVREGDQSASVIILDHSYSMSCVENGVVRFDRARQLALDVLKGLREDDLVSFILASESPEVVYANLPAANQETRIAIETSQVSYRTGDLASALALAEGVLRESEAGHREVYVITDMQRKAFERITPPAQPVPPQERLDLYLLSVGFPDTGNIALTGVDLRPRRVVPRGDFQLTFSGSTYGNVHPRFTSLTMQSTGRGLTETSIPVKSNADFAQSFNERAGEKGYSLIIARIEDEVLTVDNTRYLAVPIEEPGRVLLVEGNPRLLRRDWDTFYFERALKIYSSGMTGGRSYEVFTQGVVQELTTLDTSIFDLIVLANVPRISREIVRKLESFVQRGGNLILAFGSRVDLQAYNERMTPGLLPGTIRRVVESGRRPPYRIMAFRDKEEPLKTFSEAKQGDLTLPLFTHFVSLQPASGVSTQVMAQYETGDIALMEHSLGRGKVIIWSSSLDADWNDLPLRPLYLPFWGEILDYLESSAVPSPNYEIGDTVEIAFDFSAEAANLNSIKILMPNDEMESLEVDTSRGSYRAYFASTRLPGFYRIQVPEGRGVNRVYPAIFAVNVSPDDSNLTWVSDDEIEEKLSGWTVKRIDEPRRAMGILAAARQGHPLWDVFLLIMMIGLTAETLYANRVWR